MTSPRLSCLVVLLGAYAVAAPSARAQAQGESQPPRRTGSVFVDPVGLLLFGPTLGVEVAPAEAVALTVYGRWLDAGLVARTLFIEDDKSEFAFSYGVGLRGRRYFSAGLTGFFAGIGAEYLRTRIDDSTALISTRSQYLVPVVEGGYRLGGQRFFVDGSLGLGYAFQLSGKVENLPGGNSAGSYMAADKSSLYGSASVQLGVFF